MLSGFIALRMCQKQVANCKKLFAELGRWLKHESKNPNCKAPGRDGVQGFWLKKSVSLHSRIIDQLNDIANGVASLPEWMTYGKTV